MYIQYATWLHVFVQETPHIREHYLHEAGIVGSELSEAQLLGNLRHIHPGLLAGATTVVWEGGFFAGKK